MAFAICCRGAQRHAPTRRKETRLPRRPKRHRENGIERDTQGSDAKQTWKMTHANPGGLIGDIVVGYLMPKIGTAGKGKARVRTIQPASSERRTVAAKEDPELDMLERRGALSWTEVQHRGSCRGGNNCGLLR